MPTLHLTGLFFYEKGEYQKASNCFKRSLFSDIIKDKSASLWYLGNMYRYGYGVEKNPKQALDYYIESSNLKYSPAMFTLGHLYETGKLVEKNYKTSFEFYKQGALLDDSNCQLNLGVMYDEGLGMPTNPDKAFYWFDKASKNGCVNATYNIGMMFQEGESVQKNISKAMKHFCDAGEYNINNNIQSIQILPNNKIKRCNWEINENITYSNIIDCAIESLIN